MSTGTPEKRLQELVLYLAQKSEDDPTFGATKLNKLLYFADFAAYLKFGKPITGVDYVRRDYGPVPRLIMAACKNLETDGRARSRELTYGAYNQRRLVPLGDADLSIFAPEEIAFVDNVITQLRDKNATEVSDLSHKLAGWKLATDGELIPYYSALVPPKPLALTAGEREWATNFAAALA